MEECAKVLGTPEFDEAVFAEKVAQITIPETGTLIFDFTDGTKRGYWRCADRNGCTVKGLRDDFLRDMTAEVLGLAEFDEDVFLEKIDRITVRDGIITGLVEDDPPTPDPEEPDPQEPDDSDPEEPTDPAPSEEGE